MTYKIRGEAEIGQGFGLPRLTTTQREAYTPPSAGYQVFDTTLLRIFVHNGVTWKQLPNEDDNLDPTAFVQTGDVDQTIAGTKTFTDTVNVLEELPVVHIRSTREYADGYATLQFSTTLADQETGGTSIGVLQVQGPEDNFILGKRSQTVSSSSYTNLLTIKDDYAEWSQPLRVPAPINDADATNKEYVTTAINAATSGGSVDLTTDQTIDGRKTFTDNTYFGGTIPLTITTSGTGIAAAQIKHDTNGVLGYLLAGTSPTTGVKLTGSDQTCLIQLTPTIARMSADSTTLTLSSTQATFSTAVAVSSPTGATHATTRGYVEDNFVESTNGIHKGTLYIRTTSDAASGTIVGLNDRIRIANNEVSIDVFDNEVVFNSSVRGLSPSGDSNFATKGYVDGVAGSSVVSFVDTDWSSGSLSISAATHGLPVQDTYHVTVYEGTDVVHTGVSVSAAGEVTLTITTEDFDGRVRISL